MPQSGAALIQFAKLVALLNKDGVVQWEWFANPVKGSLLAMPLNRQYIGKLLRALLDRNIDDPDQLWLPKTRSAFEFLDLRPAVVSLLPPCLTLY
jgi:hypothetical protein